MPPRQHHFCTFPGCGQPHKAAGYCANHYQQSRRGVPLSEIRTRDMVIYDHCKEEDCTGEVVAKGLCKMHYARFLRNGHTRYRDRKRPAKSCTLPTCNDILYANGYCSKHYTMSVRLPKKYGISLHDHSKMLMEQKFVCAICKQPERDLDSRSGKRKEFAVDHCHETGRVRGLLCSSCNRGLGLFCDDADLVSHAAAYLRKG